MNFRPRVVAFGTCMLGLVLFAAGLWVDAPRAMFAYLSAYVTVVSVTVGALFFLAIAHATGAGWMAIFRRRAEDIVGAFPVLAFLFVPLALALRTLYPWAQAPSSWSETSRAAILPKLAYLNVGFFLGRAALYLSSWVIVAELLRGASRKQDTAPDPRWIARQQLVAAVSLPWLAFTITFAAFDWLMSLDPTWSSNVFGIYLFSGGFGAATGLLALLALGPFPSRVREASADVAHALGRIVFTFVIVWAYVAFVQYLLIWLADLPDEVPWLKARTTGAWGSLALALAAGHFVVPFAVLLSREVKRRPHALAFIGGWLVFAHCMDVYWLVLPRIAPGPSLHGGDVGALLFVAGAAAAVGALRAGGLASIPQNDPTVDRGVAYVASS